MIALHTLSRIPRLWPALLCLVVATSGSPAAAVQTKGTVQAPDSIRTVRLLYENGGVLSGDKHVQVYHSGPEGAAPDTGSVRSAERAYFAFRPVGDWDVSPKARGRIQHAALLQDSGAILPKTVALKRNGEDATLVVAAYPTSQVDWTASARFATDLDTSGALKLREKYAAAYPRYWQAYRRGRQFLDEGKFLHAARALTPFAGPVEPAFSFVSEARSSLWEAATRAVDKQRAAYRTLRDTLVRAPSAEGLARLDSLQARLDTVRSVLAPSFNATQEKGGRLDAQDRLATLSEDAGRLYDDVRAFHRRETLRLFMRGTYENPKLRLYLEVLTSLLVAPKPALKAEGRQVDRLNADALRAQRHARVREHLRSEGWWEELHEVLSLVNENIEVRGEVFGTESMKSLRLRRPAAPQPYYEILTAMNAVIAENDTRFEEAWERALEKTTDLSLLNELQRWRIASKTDPTTVPDRARSLAEEARALEENGKLGGAEARLQLAVSLAGGYAPYSYRLGRVRLAQADTAGAREAFDRAQAQAQAYAPPAVSELRLLLTEGRYEAALSRADARVQTQGLWLVYVPKARALMGLGRYDEARRVLRARSELLNDETFALYALLSEVYAELGVWKGVQWALHRAEALDPERPAFNVHVRRARRQAREADVSLETAVADTMGAEEMKDLIETAGQAAPDEPES